MDMNEFFNKVAALENELEGDLSNIHKNGDWWIAYYGDWDGPLMDEEMSGRTPQELLDSTREFVLQWREDERSIV